MKKKEQDLVDWLIFLLSLYRIDKRTTRLIVQLDINQGGLAKYECLTCKKVER